MLPRALPPRSDAPPPPPARAPLPPPHRRCISSQAAAVGAPGAYGGERWRGEELRQSQGAGEEETRAVKVSVWWDFESCRLPRGANPCRLVPRVTAALRAAGIRGPVEITAFGNAYVFPRAVQEALSATGVAFSHVPSSGKDGSNLSCMAYLTYWIAQNPPPVHFFLISGNKGLANILHRLRMSNYNVLLACPSAESSVLCGAATIMWPWDALVKGLDFAPKYYNQPPDGISFSSYGHYREPLDDPFLTSEFKDSMALQPHTKQVKPPILPKSVANGVRQALYSFPEGISLQNLRAELKKNNVSMDRRYFGFKSFSSLLQAMPDVVKFIDPLPGERSQPAVVGIFNRSMEPATQSYKGMSSAQSSGEVKRLCKTLNEKPSSSHVPSLSDTLSADHKKILPVDASSSQYDSLCRSQREAPHVDLNTPTETPANSTEAGVEGAAGTSPAFSRAQSTVNKKGLFEGISILWNDPEPVKPMLYPSQDDIHSKGSNDLPTQDDNNNQHNTLLRRTLKIFSGTDNLDGNNLHSTSSISSSFSNMSANNQSDNLNVKENVGNTTIHSNRSVDMSNAEHKVEFGEKSKGIFSWAAKWWASGKPDSDNKIQYISMVDKGRIRKRICICRNSCYCECTASRN
uniref:HTH OST-type domain-containing protein n=1 Tax=Oryza brachyantha TaxID=4533 RepID=J3LCN5_ORYBR